MRRTKGTMGCIFLDQYLRYKISFDDVTMTVRVGARTHPSKPKKWSVFCENQYGDQIRYGELENGKIKSRAQRGGALLDDRCEGKRKHGSRQSISMKLGTYAIFSKPSLKIICSRTMAKGLDHT